jgi:quercetin dioxygenase-like cupin family protein
MKIVSKKELLEFPIFSNVLGSIVFSSNTVMFLLVRIPPYGVVPEHNHTHEQMGICLKGKAEFRSEKGRAIVEEGMFYWIKPRETHSVTSLVDEPSLFLDVFNPPREDYIQKSRHHACITENEQSSKKRGKTSSMYIHSILMNSNVR